MNIKSERGGIPHNAIAIGTEIIAARIVATEGIRIDGKVKGDIVCENGRVVIGPEAVIEGNIECGDLEVMGSILGNIVSHKSISLSDTARVKGDMQFSMIQITFGAQFSGKCTYQRAQE